ncbi:MAG: pyrroloquinoline quinone biosynthesis protein PqqB [Pseudomonadota bacterium]
MRLLVLGAAAGGGLPQWNCAASNSGAFWAGQSDIQPATQCSIAVSADGDDWVLINASPDIRTQIIARPQLQPKPSDSHGKRNSPITGVILTNGDLDHIAGLLTLRERQAFNLYATAAIHQVLDDNPIFNALDRALVPRRPIELDQPFEIAPGLTATLFPVPGKVPLFLEQGDDIKTDQLGEQTVGVELISGDSRALFIPGCAKVTDELAARINGADLLLFDGTVFHDDEMQRAGVGQKTGRRMGHMPIAGEDGSLSALANVPAGRKLYIHLNNTNPVWRPDSDERRQVTAAGWEIAQDGLEITL